jgi:DNA-binding LytR/AlgR family response regulator
MSFKLHDFEASLAPYGFVRVHKSFIVNLDYVEGIVRDKRQIFLELPKRRVPVGNEYRKNLPGV